MATRPSSYRTRRKTEAVTAHVIWMTTGLSCDGDSVAMTVGDQPEPRGHHHRQAIPGMPRVVVHNPVLAYENGPGVHAGLVRRRGGKLDPFVLVLEGSSRQREDQRRGLLDRDRRQPRDRPADHDQRVDRPAGAEGGRGRRDRHLRHLRRHPGDEEQPDRRDGPGRLPRLELEVEGRPPDRLHPRLPGAARQHDRDAALPRAAPRRPGAGARARRGAAARSGCSAAPCARAATAPASPSRATSRPSTAPTTAAWSSSAARARWSSATCRSAAG